MTLGIYTHIPFCTAKCSYCHFTSYPYRQATASRYLKAVLKEIATTPIPNEVAVDVDTIYFGGGTPSLVSAGNISGIIKALKDRFHILEDCEISMEANPETLTYEQKFETYRRSGVNRVSMGAQSFVDHELEGIGRLHTSDMIQEAVKKLKRTGFQNISLDLMLGLPYQTRDSWKYSLKKLEELEIPHVSVYMLDLGDKCHLSELVARGSICVPDDDFLADMYEETIDILSAQGYRQYEISNFTKSGFFCRHNLKYWKRNPVIGFGLASHSFDGKVRYANYTQMKLYLECVENNQAPITFRDFIGPDKALNETLFLGLRTNEGVNWSSLGQEYGAEAVAKYTGFVQELAARNLAYIQDGTVRLTVSGMLLSNEIFQQFV